jgi:predicted RNase H-like nuclease (RuvC/YqgF family)
VNELERLTQVVKMLNQAYKELNEGVWELREELERLKAEVRAIKGGPLLKHWELGNIPPKKENVK